MSVTHAFRAALVTVAIAGAATLGAQAAHAAARPASPTWPAPRTPRRRRAPPPTPTRGTDAPPLGNGGRSDPGGGLRRRRVHRPGGRAAITGPSTGACTGPCPDPAEEPPPTPGPEAAPPAAPPAVLPAVPMTVTAAAAAAAPVPAPACAPAVAPMPNMPSASVSSTVIRRSRKARTAVSRSSRERDRSPELPLAASNRARSSRTSAAPPWSIIWSRTDSACA